MVLSLNPESNDPESTNFGIRHNVRFSILIMNPELAIRPNMNQKCLNLYLLKPVPGQITS